MHAVGSRAAMIERPIDAVTRPAAAGPPGPGGNNNLSNSALAGLLIIILTLEPYTHGGQPVITHGLLTQEIQK